MTEPVVVHSESRYEISVHGEPAGFAEYVEKDEERIFFHTEIDGKFSGQGLAGKLVAAALMDTRKAHKRIVPLCSYIAKWVAKNRDFDGVVDPVTDASTAAVRAHQVGADPGGHQHAPGSAD